MNSYQFKFKPDKIKYLTNISTLDSSHTKICEDLIKKRENLPKKELKLDKLKKKLNEMNNNTIDDNFITLKSQLITEIENLEFEIIEIKNYDTELEYYSRTYEILFNYYDIIDGNTVCNDSELKNVLIDNNIEPIKIENNNNIENNEIENSFDSELNDIGIFSKKEKLDKLEMLNYLSKLKRKEKKITRKRVKNVESLIKDNNNIFDYLDSTKELSNNPENKLDENKDNILYSKLDENINNGSDNKDINDSPNNLFDNENKKLKLDRASLYEDYKTLLEGYYAQKKSNKVCGNCNIDKILIYSEGIYACIKCGDVERCIIESDTTSYKDPMIEKPTFPYKRKNHFCEWILILSYLTARKSINSNYYW
jgi:hypothetical protein